MRQQSTQWEWIDFETLERFVKDEKKRAKYFPKIK
jgi:hypothetical protein